MSSFHLRAVGVFLLIWSFSQSSPALADLPLTRGTAARPISLGTAFAGLAADGSALFVNAAGLAELRSLNFISTYNQPADGVSFASLGLALPEKFDGTVGLGLRIRSIDSIYLSSEAVSASDQELLLAYARPLSERLSVGGALRLAAGGYSRTVAGFPASTGRALDLSLKYYYLPEWSWGLALQNLGGEIVYADGARQGLAAIYRLGTAYTYRQLILCYDLVKEEDEILSHHAGLEWWPLELLALRFGLDQSGGYNNSTAGLGLKLSGWTIDYAWYRQADAAGSVTHYFSLGQVGPAHPPPASLAPAAPAFPSPEPQPPIASRIARVRFTDLGAAPWAREAVELLATAGLLSGYPDGTFRPNLELSRTHFSQLLLSARNASAADPVHEIGGDAWAAAPNRLVSRQEAARLIGLDGAIDRPAEPLTRAEFASMFSQSPAGRAALRRLPPLTD